MSAAAALSLSLSTMRVTCNTANTLTALATAVTTGKSTLSPLSTTALRWKSNWLAAGKRDNSSSAATAVPPVCPHLANNTDSSIYEHDDSVPLIHHTSEWQNALPYEEIPGPKPIPILGNTWRMMPIIGQYTIGDVAKISSQLYEQYGQIVKFSGLIGRPDLLFIYDVDEIEKCYRTEGTTPFRPSMPSLVKYKSVVRKDFFGELGGVVGV